jgi:hypothetical protein
MTGVEMLTGVKRITRREDLVELARELRVRSDWHAPDEQDLTAHFAGDDGDFDNVGFWGGPEFGYGQRSAHGSRQEMYVELWKTTYDEVRCKTVDDEHIASVNLATLFAWASEPHPISMVNEVLRSAGLEFPVGARGVANLVSQRDLAIKRAENAEAELAAFSSADDGRTEAAWRSKLARELYDLAEKLGKECETRSLGVAISAVVEHAANQIGKMPL